MIDCLDKELWWRLALGVPCVVGVWTLFGKGMILGWLGDWLDKWLPDFIQKPLYGCLPCMSSVWGTAVWFATYGSVVWDWLVFCLALCGILKIVSATLLRHE